MNSHQVVRRRRRGRHRRCPKDFPGRGVVQSSSWVFVVVWVIVRVVVIGRRGWSSVVVV